MSGVPKSSHRIFILPKIVQQLITISSDVVVVA